MGPSLGHRCQYCRHYYQHLQQIDLEYYHETQRHKNNTVVVTGRKPILCIYTVFQKSDAKIEITITTSNLIRIKHPLSNFNYQLSGTNFANFNKIHCTEQKNRSFQSGKYQLAYLLHEVLRVMK